MKILGWLFVLVLIAGAVGFWRGWFTVRTAEAGDRRSVHIEVDGSRFDDDARDASQRVGELSQGAVDQVKSIARGASGDEKIVEGSVAVVDVAERDITVSSGDRMIDVSVPRSVDIRRQGRDVTLGELAAGQRVSLTFHVNGETWRLQRIELLS